MALMKSLQGCFVSFLFLVLTLAKANVDNDKVKCLPEQVHLAYGATVSEMVVMWSTVEDCSTEVKYGTNPWRLDNQVIGSKERLPNILPQVPYLHRVVLKGLKENTTYHYAPYSNMISTSPFFFRTPPQGWTWQPQFMVYGDLGIHSESLPYLEAEALKGVYSAILHVGDFGYNLYKNVADGPNMGENTTDIGNVSISTTLPPKEHQDISEVGDVFMQQIEDMASHVPYLVSPGNHEMESDTFNQYRYRFSTPGKDWPAPLNQMWYSINIGPVHFISYSSEVFFLNDPKYIDSQRQWLKIDLEKANENRHSHPWVVAFGHRPMYCSNGDGDDCTKEVSLVRDGLESLFYENGVDVVLQAHEHSYERLWPMYKGVVLARNYTNPQAPVQLISGAAGSKYNIDPMSKRNESWSAFRMDDRAYNSYGRLKAYNSTHLYWEEVSVMEHKVLDSIWIIQQSHGPFTQINLQPDQKEEIDEQIKKDEKNKKKPIPKPTITGDSIRDKVTKAIKGADTKLIVGVSFGVFVVIFFLVVCIVRRCQRKRPISYRRWENVDYGKKFYTNIKSDEKDGDDFEVDVTDGTTKLIED